MQDKTYWNGNGMYQADYEVLAKNLLPGNGSAGTYEGEMLRSATRLYYDYYNNGMVNNTSGAVNFLIEACEKLKNEKVNIDVVDLIGQLEIVELECNTGHYTNVSLSGPLEDIMNDVVQYVLSKKGKYTVSDVNMLDYSDPDVGIVDFDDYYDDECEDEYEDDLSFIDYDELRFED